MIYQVLRPKQDHKKLKVYYIKIFLTGNIILKSEYSQPFFKNNVTLNIPIYLTVNLKYIRIPNKHSVF